jgi:hypothetical protein
LHHGWEIIPSLGASVASRYCSGSSRRECVGYNAHGARPALWSRVPMRLAGTHPDPRLSCVAESVADGWRRLGSQASQFTSRSHRPTATRISGLYIGLTQLHPN